MDLLQLRVDALKRRQLAELTSRSPDDFAGSSRRLGIATATGLAALSRLQHQHAWLGPLTERLTGLFYAGPRYAFLDAIPDAPVLSMARAVALERVVLGTQTEQVEELALQLGLFTVLLDGLLDEVPDELALASAWLSGVMDPGTWDAPLPAPPRDLSPLAEALALLATATISTVTAMPGWRRDKVVREQFSQATRAAFAAELASADLTCSSGGPSPETVTRILAKSTHPIWCGALLPLVVHGWPDGLEPTAFRDLSVVIGTFGGWVDDVVDVAEDLRANRWSMALIELDRVAGAFNLDRANGDPRPAIVAALDSSLAIELVADAGGRRWDAVVTGLAGLGLPPDEIRAALCDMAGSCLRTGLRERA